MISLYRHYYFSEHITIVFYDSVWMSVNYLSTRTCPYFCRYPPFQIIIIWSTCIDGTKMVTYVTIIWSVNYIVKKDILCALLLLIECVF